MKEEQNGCNWLLATPPLLSTIFFKFAMATGTEKSPTSKEGEEGEKEEVEGEGEMRKKKEEGEEARNKLLGLRLRCLRPHWWAWLNASTMCPTHFCMVCALNGWYIDRNECREGEREGERERERERVGREREGRVTHHSSCSYM